MAEPMKIRATLQGDVADVRILMLHPMETGARKDSRGDLVPQHFIQNGRLRQRQTCSTPSGAKRFPQSVSGCE